MKKLAPILLTLSFFALGSCTPKPVVVAVDLICAETTRYHTTDAQGAEVRAKPDLWDSLFRWLAAFDEVRDKRCKS